ncbi:MAG TPA: hypothetical protein EYQ50_11050 [Verrucomicrobiales bacterium]|nr:hypothetical protein [Verrucomicrobiales bacterium]
MDDKGSKTGFKLLRKPNTTLAASMATSPVALTRSLRPDLDVKIVVELIKRGADDLGAPGWDKGTGHGRLNYLATLELVKAWPQEHITGQ